MIPLLGYCLKTLSLDIVNELDQLWQATDIHSLTSYLETVFCFYTVLKHHIGFCCTQSMVASTSCCFVQNYEDCTENLFLLLLCLPSGIFSHASCYFITHSAASNGRFELSVLQVSLPHLIYRFFPSVG